jgi:hypothetical protein
LRSEAQIVVVDLLDLHLLSRHSRSALQRFCHCVKQVLCRRRWLTNPCEGRGGAGFEESSEQKNCRLALLDCDCVAATIDVIGEPNAEIAIGVKPNWQSAFWDFPRAWARGFAWSVSPMGLRAGLARGAMLGEGHGDCLVLEFEGEGEGHRES